MSVKKIDVKLFGASWCPYCVSTKAWLDANKISYEYHDVDIDGQRDEMHKYTPSNETIPVVVIDGVGFVNPDVQTLTEKIGVAVDGDKKIYDVIMIGAGPSALTAAIYTTRENIETLMFEKGIIGGLAATTDWVDNYPGFPDGVAGLELSENMRKQAERFGAQFELGEVTKISDEGDVRKLETTSGDYWAKTILIATGSDFKKLGIPGEDEFYGRGVHYCATCDGAFYRDKSVVVVGGGNSAVQEAMFLTRFATHIDLLVRGPELRASEVLQHELAEKHADKITVHYNVVTDKIVGGEDGKVCRIEVTRDGKADVVITNGVFVFIGLKPNTAFAADSGIELDELKLIKTDNNLMTNMNGVFASGDVRSGATMQIASATGEGATAALMIRKFIEGKL